MEALIAQIKRVWPQASWSISQYEKNRFVGYVSNGEMIGTKKFASGWQEARTALDALDKAFRAALSKDYRK